MRALRARRLSAFLLALALLPPACGGSSEEPSRCHYAGKTYGEGDSFPSDDGCNTCSCMSDGNVGCTAKACLSCDDISAMYGSLMEQATRCDPNAPDPCSEKVVGGLRCGCETYVNPNEYDARAASSLQQLYMAASCGEGIVCGPCLEPPSAHCSDDGACVDDQP